jgi:hypothetical protein
MFVALVIWFAVPSNVTTDRPFSAAAVSVGLAEPDAVKSFPFPLLSFHVLTDVPSRVMLADDESAPSSHNTHPLISVGALTAVTGPASVV